MAAKAWVFLLNLLLLSKASFSSPVYLDRVIKAVDRLIVYYKNNYRDLNVDGLFGLRVMEGHLSAIIEKYENRTIQGIDFKVIEKLKTMKSISSKISIEALDFVRKDDEEYFKSMEFIIGNPWALHKDYKKLQFQLLWEPSVYKEALSSILKEKESDRCMMEIMGYQPSRIKCGVSQFCIELMTRKGLTGYAITHQILWTMLSEQAGCFNELSQKLVMNGRGRTENIQLELCTNNYLEMMQIVHGTLKGQIIPRFQDLFMEQQFVCPSLGYYQFLSDEFLGQILSWQRDVGCYGTMKRVKASGNVLKYEVSKDYNYENESVLKFNSKVNKSKTISDFTNLQPPILSLVPESVNKRLGSVHMSHNVVIQKGADLVTKGIHGITLEKTQKSSIKSGSRRLMAEKEMEDGCLAHKTAVAAGALMVYLRYLILPGPKTLEENTKEMLQQRHLLNINDSGVEKFFKGAKVVKQLKDTHQKGHAMNNNQLVAQMNDNDKDDDYYADENDEDEEEDEDENDEKGGNKNVQFDNHQKDDKKDNGYEDEYEDGKNENEKSLLVKNIADNDKNLPKPDDTDYTYYEDKNKHDDYTNEEYDEKDDNAEKEDKDTVSDKIKIKLIKESKNDEQYSQSGMQSPSGVFIVISCTIFVLLIFMYRFLRNRRVHIRYNYKNFNRV